jgi:hypothetical protein
MVTVMKRGYGFNDSGSRINNVEDIGGNNNGDIKCICRMTAIMMYGISFKGENFIFKLQ